MRRPEKPLTNVDFEGIKFPMAMTVKSPMIPMPLDMKVADVEINQELLVEEFEP